MYTDLALYIDGKWLNGGGRKGEDVLNPATEKPLPERWNREGPCQQDWTQLEQLAASKLLELTAFNRRLHQNTQGSIALGFVFAL